ncbi:hypothetical protein [Corynebacterium provencense]|uniref:hypothetical protein n=1 Tax=Corynebacterium provencense TaxID=1737425 RepID=UPI000833D86D|nr:hypothetical protein [Corynebacterium provencense]
MTTTRFDQRPGPYGHCMTCDAVFTTPEEAQAHLEATYQASKTDPELKSHPVRGTNLTRAQRIQSHIDTLVSDKLREYGDLDGRELIMNEDTAYEVVLDLLREINRDDDYTVDEAITALTTLREPDIITALREEVDA